MSDPSQLSYEFGPFSLDAGKRLLLRNGEPVPVTPKVMELLLALIEHRDRVLTKDELLKQVWGDTIVEEGGLTRNVSVLRKTLGEKPDDHQVHRHRARQGISVRGGGARKAATRELAGRAAAATTGSRWTEVGPFCAWLVGTGRRGCARRSDCHVREISWSSHARRAKRRARGSSAGTSRHTACGGSSRVPTPCCARSRRSTKAC